VLYSISMLVFGTLYPTYLSYKALKDKDSKECARLMMYWIVFALFTSFEGFLDIFVGLWFPFYFESKIIFLFWLISPYGNGAKILYENFVHKKFEEKEKVIDDFISSMKHFSIDIFWKTWSKCSVYANYLLLLSFTKAQVAFVQYMNSQQQKEPFTISNAFSSLTSTSTSTPMKAPSLLSVQLESEIQVVQVKNEVNEDTIDSTIPEQRVEEMETEQSIMSQVESFKSDDEETEVRRPGRKTKRKRRVVSDTPDISHRPVTRAAAKSIAQATSDVEVL